MGLSKTVKASVCEAVSMIENLVERIYATAGACTA